MFNVVIVPSLQAIPRSNERTAGNTLAVHLIVLGHVVIHALSLGSNGGIDDSRGDWGRRDARLDVGGEGVVESDIIDGHAVATANVGREGGNKAGAVVISPCIIGRRTDICTCRLGRAWLYDVLPGTAEEHAMIRCVSMQPM